jgi:hypothetical protein
MKDVGCGVLFFIIFAKNYLLLFTMKKLFVLLIGLMFMQLAYAQDWSAQLVSSTDNEIVVELNVNGFNTNRVTTPNGDAVVITNKKMMSMAQAGEPNVPSLVIPAVVGDNALMAMEVVDAQYVDYQNVEVAPSKGNFPRSIDPDDVPYTYGAMYQQDAFYPSQIANLDEPYIHRDVRGQNMVVTPYVYNPVTKTLRVYNHLVLKMKNVGVDNRNVIENRAKSVKVDREFNKMYNHRYINYAESMSRYTAIAEDGELLIICHDAFMTAMEPFVAWKKQIGRPTTMVGTSVTGNNANVIKAYIQSYYAEHPNLTDILLVGDVAQIPGVYIQAATSWGNFSGYGDVQYGQLAGNDYYNEVLVGRFCCETEAQVVNHVNKVLNYERDLDETATWLSVGQGVSKNEGAGGGHYGEADYQHIDNIKDDLLNYNYTAVHRDYQGVDGVTASAATVSQHINEGVSIINYCNHGNITLWGVFNYNNSQVNALTNDYKLPYIISVACLNGKYDNNGDCFAEAWMRATNNSNGNPTGAIGGMFSYISQPWQPPMYGQDEMVDILVESYNNNIRHTMGGVSINGNMKVLDLGSSGENKGTYNTWILFGDPTLTLRNTTPAVMNVTAASTMRGDDTNFTVLAANADGALATLTFQGEILGSAVINNGVADITFPAPGTTGTATLTVFGYNKKTYVTTVEITDGPTPAPLLVIAVANPEELILGETTTLTANVTGGTGTYTYEWSPAETITDPTAASTTATPTEMGHIIYVVTVSDGNQTTSADVTVMVNAPQPLDCPGPDGFAGTDYVDGDEIGARLSWEAADYEYTLDRFEIYRSQDGVGFEMVQRIVNTPSITHYEVMDPVKYAGFYQYRIVAFYQNNCESDYIEIEVEVTGDDNVGETSAANVAMYPNPTSGMVTVKAEAMRQLTIVNVMGQVMMTQAIDNDEVVLDMSSFDNGMYMVNIITDNGNVVKVLNVLR